MAPPRDEKDPAPRHHAPPLASVGLAAARAAARPSPAAALRAVPLVPAGPGRRAVAAPAPQRAPRRAHQPPASAAAPASTAREDQQQRQGPRPWRLPLAAGALLAHLARSAASHVLPPLLPGGRPSSPAAAGDARVFPSLLPRRAGGGGAGRPGLPGGRKPSLVWFRSDLRIHDHEPLAAACAASTSLLPVYVFDPREYGKTPTGFDKTGPYRARFILESLGDLRGRLRAAGSDLVVRVGKPEEVLPQLARSVGAGAVYCHAEVTAEEGQVEAAVARGLDRAGAVLKVMWGGTLHHVDDLPFRLGSMPCNYSEFKRALAGRPVRPPAEAPEQLKGLPVASVPAGELPALRDLGFDDATLRRCAADSNAAGATLRGGETEALRRLEEFLSLSRQEQQQEQQRRQAGAGGGAAPGGSNFCCKISPWLALGCLSPRHLFAQLQREAGALPAAPPAPRSAAGAEGTGVQWLLFELLWRDFFKFIAKKYAAAAPAPQRRGQRQALPQAAPALAPAPALAGAC